MFPFVLKTSHCRQTIARLLSAANSQKRSRSRLLTQFLRMTSGDESSTSEGSTETNKTEPSSNASENNNNSRQQTRQPVGTCRMQDVILLPNPLTDLYGSAATLSQRESRNDPGPNAHHKGAEPIPEHIFALCKQIKNCKTNGNNLPIRSNLKRELPEHFNARSRTLKKGSPLLHWFGDTRLLSEKEWIHLRGDDSEAS